MWKKCYGKEEKPMKKLLVLMTVLTYCLGGHADEITESRHTHGNAGDPLRTFYSEARVMAEDRVTNLKICEFKSGVNEAKAKWLVSIKDQLAQDIKKSKHVWLSDFQGSCAFTQYDVKGAPVYLSYPECRSTQGNHLEAMELLIHESLHHLGVEEEVDAEEYAAMIMEADILTECPTQPYDPFDAKTCGGRSIQKADILNYFQAGANTSAVVGKTKAAARYRKCNTLTGCADWQSRPSVMQWSYSNLNKTYQVTEAELEKNFRFSILSHTVPSFNVLLGQNSLNCQILLEKNKAAQFLCNPRKSIKLGSRSYSFSMQDIHTKQPITLRSRNSSDNKQVMKFNQSCFWTKATTKGPRGTNGDYLESEVVYYSNF